MREKLSSPLVKTRRSLLCNDTRRSKFYLANACVLQERLNVKERKREGRILNREEIKIYHIGEHGTNDLGETVREF
jgi:hypothetical protein